MKNNSDNNLTIDPNNASFWFGKMDSEIKNLVASQKEFQSEIKRDIDNFFSKFRESEEQINLINVKLEKLENKLDDSKTQIELDTLKRQKTLLMSIVSAVLSIITSLVIAYITFKNGWK